MVELARVVEIRMISMTKEQQKKCLDAVPSFIPVRIPAGTYKEIDYDVLTIGGPTGIICRPDVPEEDVYAIVKAFFTDVKERNQFHPQAQRYTLEAMVEVGKIYTGQDLAYHSGVIKYLKEVGAWKPELEVK